MKTKPDPARMRACLLLSIALLAPTLATADVKSAPPIQLDAVVFKENGRLDARIVAECDIEEKLRAALAYELRHQSRRDAPAEPRSVTLRIDRVDKVGDPGPPTPRNGTELGVTAIPSGHATGQLFLCRKMLSPFQPSHCSRINECTKKIAGDIMSWLHRLK